MEERNVSALAGTSDNGEFTSVEAAVLERYGNAAHRGRSLFVPAGQLRRSSIEGYP